MTQKRKGQRVEYAKITSSVTASIPPIKKITGCDDKGIDVKKTIWPIVWLVKKQYPPSESLGNIFIKNTICRDRRPNATDSYRGL